MYLQLLVTGQANTVCNYCCRHYGASNIRPINTNVMPVTSYGDCDYCGMSPWLDKEIQKLYARIIELEQEIDINKATTAYKIYTALDFIDTLSAACHDVEIKLGGFKQ